jgi:hypothetical protein
MTKSSKSDLSRPVLDAGEWLAGSGIQSRSSNKALAGGVSAWYEIHLRRYPFLYSEITGYAITSFMWLHRLTGEARWKGRAQAAAAWLLRNAIHPTGGVKTRYYLVKNYKTPNYSFDSGYIYAFDTAMAGYGLLQLHKIAPGPKLWSAARAMHRFLTRTLKTKGVIAPYWDAKTRRTGQNLGKWSDQPGGFHGKLALFLIDYYRMTGAAADRREAEELLDATVRLQQKDGRFITNRSDGSTHLHPHSYTLEGLLYGAVFLGNRSWLESARKGLEWARSAISENGSVSAICEHGGFAFHERSDIVAQVLRVGSILHALKAPVLSSKDLHRVREHLGLFQFAETGGQHGGFLYGSDTDGRMRIHLNAWATMFAMQAIWMHDAFVLRRGAADLEQLI